MYKKVLLASDGTFEGLIALREGALMVKEIGADAFLLIITPDQPGLRMADSVHPVPRTDDSRDLLERGLQRMAALGVRGTGAVTTGEPAQQIGAYARHFGADLVVVGHRRQGLLERWWSGASGAYLVDNVECSVLIARQVVSDEEFEKRLRPAATA
jgi:nucleotide-binding universal stress UspA family protein